MIREIEVNGKAIKIKIKVATGLALAFLDIVDKGAFAAPWRTVYMRPGKLQDTGLVAHELKHEWQMETEGRILWLIKYCYYQIRYGYENNPYEIEARKVENEVNQQSNR